jgi:hypothetical protein
VKTSPKRSYTVIENERFGLVFAKTVTIISGTEQHQYEVLIHNTGKRAYCRIRPQSEKSVFSGDYDSCVDTVGAGTVLYLLSFEREALSSILCLAKARSELGPVLLNNRPFSKSVPVPVQT